MKTYILEGTTIYGELIRQETKADTADKAIKKFLLTNIDTIKGVTYCKEKNKHDIEEVVKTKDYLDHVMTIYADYLGDFKVDALNTMSWLNDIEAMLERRHS